MALKEILSIAGKPGLYRFVAQGRSGIIVEPLAGGQKMAVPITAHLSALADITIYTQGADTPLHQVFTAMQAHDAEIRALNIRKDPEGVRALFAQVLPTYLEGRVYVHDMQRAFQWYIALTGAGVTDFSPEDTAPEASPETQVEG